MNPNDAHLIRAYTRRVGSTVPDYSLSAADPVEVVIQGEAGFVLGNSGAPYDIYLEVLDITAGVNPRGNFSVHVAGEAFNAAHGWLDYTKLITINPDAGFVAGHLYKYHACLMAANDITSMVESPLFMLT